MNTKSVTMQDIAREAGVSQTTVSMVLNEKGDSFPPETVAKIMTAASNLGYSFKKRKKDNKRIAVLVIATTITNPYYGGMAQCIDKEALAHNVRVMYACSYHNAELEKELVQTAIDSNYMGIIFLYPPEDIEAYEEARSSINIVVLCNRVRHIRGDCIQINNFESGSIAARHLLELGHKKIAVMTNSQRNETTSNATRLAGITSELEKALPKENILILQDNSGWDSLLNDQNPQYNIGYKLAQNEQLYEKGFTGIICSNDLMAYGVMDYLTKNGYRIPEDFSVIGNDNLRYSGMPQIGLTTVNPHSDVIAAAAFSTLINRFRLLQFGQDASKATRLQVRCDVELIVRGSTGPVGQK